jgi:hypothetical protein
MTNFDSYILLTYNLTVAVASVQHVSFIFNCEHPACPKHPQAKYNSKKWSDLR